MRSNASRASSTIPAAIADGKIYNIGNPHNLYSIRQLAQMMLEIALARPEYAPTARNTRLVDISALEYYGKGYADIPARLPSIKNTTAELGWKPTTDMRSALTAIFDSYAHASALGLGAALERCLEDTRIGLKVDVDTLRGTREGVPRLAALFKKHGVEATFYFSVGPDHTGRAMRAGVPQGIRSESGAHLGPEALRAEDPDVRRAAAGAGHRPRSAGRRCARYATRASRWGCIPTITYAGRTAWRAPMRRGPAGNSSGASRRSSVCSASCRNRMRRPAGRSTPTCSSSSASMACGTRAIRAAARAFSAAARGRRESLPADTDDAADVR